MRKTSKVSALLPLICLFLIGCTASTSYGQTGQDDQSPVEIDINLVQLTMNCTQNFLPGEVVATHGVFEIRTVALVSLEYPYEDLELRRYSVREVGSECELLVYGYRDYKLNPPIFPYDADPAVIHGFDPMRRSRPIANELILPLEQMCIRNATQASQLELCRQQATDEFIRNSIIISYSKAREGGRLTWLGVLLYEGKLYPEEGPLQ